jgi:hypothetical protein
MGQRKTTLLLISYPLLIGDDVIDSQPKAVTNHILGKFAGFSFSAVKQIGIGAALGIGVDNFTPSFHVKYLSFLH